MKGSVVHKLIGLVVILALIGLDRITKVLAVSHLKGQDAIEIIPGVFELRYLENSGAAFGILQGKMWLFYILTLIIGAACVIIYFRTPSTLHFLPLRIILILLTAGAVGNFIDRVTQHYVVDFFYFKLIDFPIFNVADIYVSVAACMLIVFILFFYKEQDLQDVVS